MKTLFCLILIAALLAGAFPAAAEEGHFNWYEVFVYSYKDSDGDGIGDLRGLLSKLGYIRDMGFRGLWLMPVMPSPSYHKYDVTDYFAVDPQYGSLEDLKTLVASCHELGIQIILDLPLNHTSTLHPWFRRAGEALKNGDQDDAYVGYYHFQEEAASNYVNLSGTKWYYEEQFAGGRMPDLNLDNEKVRDEIREILSFWLVDCGVDGFRLDAVTSFYATDDPKNIEFLRFLKETSEGLKPGSFLVGECWKGLSQIAEYYGSGIDSFFLFPAAQAEGYVAASMRSRKPAKTYVSHLGKVLDAIPEGILAPFLSNHDTGRTVGLVQGRQSPERVKFAHALTALMGGYSFTYYGEEIGMAGSGADPNKRLGMLWNEEDVTNPPPGATTNEYPYPGVQAQEADPGSLLNYVRKLNNQRLQMPAVALGELGTWLVTDDTCVMTRTYEGETLYIAVNFSGKDVREVIVPGNLRLLDTLDAGGAASSTRADSEGVLVTLQPYGIAYLRQD